MAGNKRWPRCSSGEILRGVVRYIRYFTQRCQQQVSPVFRRTLCLNGVKIERFRSKYLKGYFRDDRFPCIADYTWACVPLVNKLR